MKRLMILVILVFSNLSMASVDMGGVLKTRDGERMKFVCESINEDNICEKIKVMAAWNQYSDFYEYNVIDIEPIELSRDAFRVASSDLNEFYFGAGFAGTGIGAMICGYGGVTLSCLGLFPIGLAIDIAKAPVVGVAYIGHKLGDLLTKRRFKKHFKHLMNLKKKGEVRKISNRDFRALKNVLY